MKSLFKLTGFLILILVFICHCGCQKAKRHNCLEVSVSANGFERIDKPVIIDINRSDFVHGENGHVRIVEIDENQATIDANVVHQIDWDHDTTGSGELVFLMKGRLKKDAFRTYRIFFSPEKPLPSRPKGFKGVGVERIGVYEGDDTYRITTANATYFYHVNGSAFAGMVDLQGNDWIGFHPTVKKEDGPKGAYRGVPNLWHAGFHPGQTKGKKPSEILSNGPVRVRLLSRTEDGQWKCTWDIYPEYATMTLFKRGKTPYWILYEGTPGGEFNLTDYFLFSNGHRESFAAYTADKMWDNPIPSPKWICFGDIRLKRVLFAVSHHDHGKDDQIWHFGEGTMTVFGFGRGKYGTKQWQQLKKIPARYTFGFCEDNGFDKASRTINNAYRPLKLDFRFHSP